MIAKEQSAFRRQGRTAIVLLVVLVASLMVYKTRPALRAIQTAQTTGQLTERPYLAPSRVTATPEMLWAESSAYLRIIWPRSGFRNSYFGCCAVILAANGQEALRLFQENSKKIRLAVLDVVMPIMSGPDAYRQMCAIRPDLLVVFTSGHTGWEVAPLSHQSEGSSVFLQKPYSPQTLGQAIRRTLDGD